MARGTAGFAAPARHAALGLGGGVPVGLAQLKFLLLYEHFHGANGAGLGASHQTGWTGVIARGMHVFATSNAEQVLELGKMAAFTELKVEAQRG